jgi:hypothetical protein
MIERLYRGLLHLYPAGFRTRFADDMVQLFGDQMRLARTEGPPVAVAATWLRAIADLAATAASEHIRRDRTVGHSLSVSPSNFSRVLGLIGVLGGLALLLPFLPVLNSFDLNGDLFNLRLTLFNIGAIAIVIVVHRRQAPAAPRLALVAAVATITANALYLAATVLLVSRPGQPGPGDFGLGSFYVGLALWLTDAAFGFVTLRLGVLARWGPIALAIGSLLAILGMDRIELTSPTNPTIFGTLALAGIALNGIGWILLGLDVATRRRASVAQPEGASPRG